VAEPVDEIVTGGGGGGGDLGRVVSSRIEKRKQAVLDADFVSDHLMSLLTLGAVLGFRLDARFAAPANSSRPTAPMSREHLYQARSSS
jgi:hypothetical protein